MQAEQEWISVARRTLLGADVDFFQIKPWRYWSDFAISLVLAYSLASLFLAAPLASVWQFAAFPFAVFWLYRLGSLVHEVCHLGQHEMRLFKTTWNLLVGVVTLSPSPFFTRHHRDHHSCRIYGTHEDPEYVVNFYRGGGTRGAFRYAFEVVIFPLLVFLRFLFAPCTFLHPRLRDFVLRRGCALTLNWRYERKVSTFDRRVLTGIELLCFLRAALMLVAVYVGWTHWTRLPLFYALAIGVLALNQLRLLGDHHLASDGRGVMALDDHILDSCNYPRRDFGVWLLCPFAIRYHALHHMFPSLPYHNLAAVHAYLDRELHADSPYHLLSQPGWWSVAKHAFRDGNRRDRLKLKSAVSRDRDLPETRASVS
jgi:fatty acid desaturase